MPLMHAVVTPGAFTARQKDLLAQGLTQAACNAESIPDDPVARARALVFIHELPEGHFYAAGEPAHARVRGVFATLQVSSGVLDAARKARLAADVQTAARAALVGFEDGRTVMTSLVIDEIPEGQWCQGGHIARLPEMAAIARFQHLCPDVLPDMHRPNGGVPQPGRGAS